MVAGLMTCGDEGEEGEVSTGAETCAEEVVVGGVVSVVTARWEELICSTRRGRARASVSEACACG